SNTFSPRSVIPQAANTASRACPKVQPLGDAIDEQVHQAMLAELATREAFKPKDASICLPDCAHMPGVGKLYEPHVCLVGYYRKTVSIQPLVVFGLNVAFVMPKFSK